MPSEFKNEAFVDFNNPKIAAEMEKALSKVSSSLGKEYPLIVGGERITTDGKINSINPSNPSDATSGSVVEVTVEVRYSEITWLPGNFFGLGDPNIFAESRMERE